MTYRIRKTPTAEGAKAIRSALKDQGIAARVSKQRYAYRIVSNDPRTLAALIAINLQGPAGGNPIQYNASEFSAYEFAA